MICYTNLQQKAILHSSSSCTFFAPWITQDGPLRLDFDESVNFLQ